MKKIIYTADVTNSILELVEHDPNFDATSVLPVYSGESAMKFFNLPVYSKRDFWEIAKQYGDKDVSNPELDGSVKKLDK